jgi:hypothetical protein
LVARGRELAMLLHHHRLAEERWFLAPLRTRDEAAAARDLAEHQQLEEGLRAWTDALDRLDGRGTAADGHAFYLQVSDFHARYLAHVLHEERDTEPAMFARFSDEEVAGFTTSLLQAVELPVLVASLRHIVPAQSDAESRALLASLRGAPFFDDVRAALRDELGEAGLARLLDG